jgi:hypothetical protein
MRRHIRIALLGACSAAILFACGADDSSPGTPGDAGSDGVDATLDAPGNDGNVGVDAADSAPPPDGPVADAADGGGSTDAADASDAADAADSADAQADVDAGPCGPNRVFRTAVPLSGGIDGGQNDDYNIKLSLDELSAYFSSNRAGDYDIYSTSRAARTADFSAATAVTPLNGAGTLEFWGSPNEASTLLVLERDSKLYVATRASSAVPWGAPVFSPELDVIGDAGAGFYSGQPHLTADGTTVYFASSIKGTWDIFRSTRTGTTWTTPVTVDELNTTTALEWAPTVTADGLTVYFGSDRGGTGHVIWVATRASVAVPFGTAHKVAELDKGQDEWPSWISPDNCRLYFTQKVDVGGGFQAYRSFVAEQ